ncbi:MAG: RnfABCDGE type electron transport complex subunit D [Oscillospiraceae bacterium]|nr:RnfABCDGE type electron transport complex subunit D [Oscillospiraceae bacterium]
MTKLLISPAPHIHEAGSSTRRIMLDVIIALIPAAIAGVVIFGISALWTILVCVASTVLSEFLFNLCAGKKQTVGDLSAVVTGLLLALNLSTNVPLWQCALGGVFAMVVVKGFFGGIGKNLVNPAIAARVFLLLAFTGTVAGGAAPVADATSSATPLVTINQGVEAAKAISLSDLFLGTYGGAIGETCAVALLLGFVYLVVRKVIKWYVPASFAATVFVCAFLFGGFDAGYALQHVLAGGVLLGAIFMATDYVTTPATGKGRVVFCIGAGILTYLIRRFGAYPEGVSIAILTMNLLTPFISDLTKRKTLGGVK